MSVQPGAGHPIRVMSHAHPSPPLQQLGIPEAPARAGSYVRARGFVRGLTANWDAVFSDPALMVLVRSEGHPNEGAF